MSEPNLDLLWNKFCLSVNFSRIITSSALKLITNALKTQCNTDDHNQDENIDFDVPSDNGNQTLLPATTRKRKVFCESKLSNCNPSETAPLKKSKVQQSTTKESNQQQTVVAEEINNEESDTELTSEN